MIGKKSEDYTKYHNVRFGKILVLSFSRKAKHGIAMMNVKCDCGVEKEMRLASLKCGRAISCGCHKLEFHTKRLTTHGSRNKPLYAVWCAMKQRCYNENDNSYDLYGAKGVRICSEWFKDFAEFQSWALSNGYKKGLSIDRINSKGDYKPSNCRWADNYTQANNTGRNVVLSFNGMRRTVAQWARHLGFSDKLIYDRINKLGWTIDKALSTPPRKMKTQEK